MKKPLKKKTIWKKKEGNKNIKKAKRISDYLEYRDVYDALIDYKKIINF